MITHHLLLLTLLVALHPAQSTIQIIGTGTGRTGSTTLHEALSILGFKTYHMKEIFVGGKQRSSELDFWFDAFATNCSHPQGLKDILDKGGYTATVHAINFPCHDALLFDMYPRAKVIHTERASAELWHDSVSNSICKAATDTWIGRVIGLLFPLYRRFKRFTPLLIGKAIFGVHGPIENVTPQYCQEHREQMIDFYNAHNAHIRKIVPAERLLIVSNHKEGWKPICDFLGVPIPDVPFPHVNKRGSMLKNVLAIMGKLENFSRVVKFLFVLITLFPLAVLLGRVYMKSKKPKAE